ncbi:MAG TPA: PilZ domain-containing protein [Terriglobales bacterium]
MKPTALLISRDLEALFQLQSTLDGLEVGWQVCYSPEEALDAVVHTDFSLLVVDFELPHASQVARMARVAAPHRKVVAGAVVSGQTPMTTALQADLQFVLHKPLDPEEVEPCLHAYKRSMRSERRTTARPEMRALVQLQLEGRDLPALARDVSEHGIALQAVEPLPRTRDVLVRFLLPGTKHKVESLCEVIWSEQDGRAGLFFSSLTPQSRKHLRQWLAQHHSNPKNAVRVLLPPLQRWFTHSASR